MAYCRPDLRPSTYRVIRRLPTRRDSSGVRSSPRITRFTTPCRARVCALTAGAGRWPGGGSGVLIAASLLLARELDRRGGVARPALMYPAGENVTLPRDRWSVGAAWHGRSWHRRSRLVTLHGAWRSATVWVMSREVWDAPGPGR